MEIELEIPALFFHLIGRIFARGTLMLAGPRLATLSLYAPNISDQKGQLLIQTVTASPILTE